MFSRLSKSLNGVLLLIMAVIVGYVLIKFPGTIIDTYHKAAQHGPLLAYLYLASVALGSLIILAVFIRLLMGLIRNTRRKQKRIDQQTLDISQMSDREIEEAIDSQLGTVTKVAEDLDFAGANRDDLDEQVAQLEHKRASQTLEIIAFGTISSGKSALLNALCGREVFQTNVRGGTTTTRNEVPWTGGDRVMLVDTPGIGEVDNEEHARIAKESAQNADLVLLVLDGPLRESEFETLEVLGKLKKPLHVCLNKTDWYGDEQKDDLLRQIAKQVRPWVDPRDVTSVQAKPINQTRIRVKADGREEQEVIDVPPDISILARRMLGTIDRDGRDMLLANLLLRSRALADDAREQVQEALDNRANHIVYLYMWRAGAVAAVVPMPMVDVAAGITISTKMVLELARVYRQEIDLKTAEQLLKEVAKNLVTVLGANAVAPAIGSMIGSALKTVPGIGTLTGGAVQGLTQALVTRWIGKVFIEYFKNEMRPPKGGLGAMARRKWDQVSAAKEIADMAITRFREAEQADELDPKRMTQTTDNDQSTTDRRFRDAVDAVQCVITELGRCSEDERAELSRDGIQLRQMLKKLRDGRVDIVVFGEISTGKSAMINALIGEEAASVSAEGGWTRESWLVAWDKCGYHVPGLADSKVALIDTPGINEVGGEARAQLARDAAAHGDLILFVTDSDLNQTEYESLKQLIDTNRPVIVVLNKRDLYSDNELEQLISGIRDERFADALPEEDLVITAADPKKIEYVIEEEDGNTRTEMRFPAPDTEALRARVMDVLGRDGKSLLAFNAALFAADKSDKIASVKVKMRERKANRLIWTYAASKAVATGVNPLPLLDIFGGTLVDASQIVALGKVYDIKMTKRNAAGLIKAIVMAAGWVTLSQVATHLGASFIKGLTAGTGTLVTAPVQGAAAGYGSYIVGQAAKYYLEHGASWGGKSPKAVVADIIANTDKESVIRKLKDEVRAKLKRNPHAAG